MRSDQEEQILELQPVLRRMARRFCPANSDIQDEFVQLMNESIIRHIDTIDDKKLLLLTAKLDAIDKLRQIGNLFSYRNKSAQVIYDVSNLVSDYNYDDITDSIVVGEAIRGVYPTLNTTQRYTINLFLLGYNQHEIARLLNRSGGLISVSLKRIVEAIRKCIEPG